MAYQPGFQENKNINKPKQSETAFKSMKRKKDRQNKIQMVKHPLNFSASVTTSMH